MTVKKKQAKPIRIPKSYRKPMKERKFRKLQSMLTDESEKKTMDSHFPDSGNSRRLFQPPADKRTGKKIAGILGKVRKARQGPRTVRIVLLAVVVLSPILFNLFFLDTIVSRQLEKVMEKNLDTDVGVTGLDISIFKGRVKLDDLSVASMNDPLIDSVAFENIDLDFDLGVLLYRRVRIEKIIGELSLNRSRKVPAEYPSSARDVEGAGSEDTLASDNESGVGLDWMPIGDLPNESVELASRLRKDAEEEAEQWQKDLEAEKNRIENLIKETQDFANKPLPDKSNVPAWLKHIEEGKSLADEIKGYENLIDVYRDRMDETITTAQNASVETRKALEADLATLQESFIPDADMVNDWIASAIGAYAGPGINNAYSRGMSLYSRFAARDIINSDSRRSKAKRNLGRMKSGRLVHFPVRLPPRFTVDMLDLQGSGVVIQGSNLGVDHDLAGAPSVLSLKLNGAAGMPGLLSLDTVIDGREEAMLLVDGNFNAELPSRSIELSAGNGSQATIGTTTIFSVPKADDFVLDAAGSVKLSDWEKGSGSLDFINSSTPPLVFNYEGRFTEVIESLKITVEKASLKGWAGVLALSLLPAGTDEARAELEKAIGIELSGIDNVLEGLISGENDINGLDSSLSSAENELEALLDDMAGQAGVDIPLEQADEVLGGLKSIFGN